MSLYRADKSELCFFKSSQAITAIPVYKLFLDVAYAVIKPCFSQEK